MSQQRFDLLSKLVTANHVLSYHGLVDGFGHVSVRDPDRSDAFLMTGSKPPALIRTAGDIDAFLVEDAQPLKGDRGPSQSPFSERFIHSEIYKMYPAIQSIVHSHSRVMVARANSGVPLRPVWHMAGFLGPGAPVFDTRGFYGDGEKQLTLVNSHELGRALASTLVDSSTSDLVLQKHGLPPHTTVLQRGHGFVTWGTSVEQAVYRAIYAQQNAEIQQEAEELARGSSGGAARCEYLGDAEWRDCAAMNDVCWVKAWPLWVAQVRSDPLYENHVQDESR
ncbi:arad-like aldolase/epimerase [Purpureocillium lavendulum]|uniref:Arad-like aldolase/epimerase n=1 Tax=Purpureocillium lavendulum TaxID=1247861 RepID=A0AB34FKF8_9HYPO|nr:arad-like aldolase/epimerase [Purpureocillium lavendulum]